MQLQIDIIFDLLIFKGINKKHTLFPHVQKKVKIQPQCQIASK
jgi:hypothetical protein